VVNILRRQMVNAAFSALES